MRVLFTVPPALGHLFPVIPLAWAFRAAGHEVLVASSGIAVDAAVRAGLPAVDVAPDADFAAVFEATTGSPRDRAAQSRERGKAIAAAGGKTPGPVLQRFARVSDLLADGTLSLAEDWRPDLIVHSRLQGAGPMAARALDIPAVEHGFGFMRDMTFAQNFLPYLANVYERHRVPVELPRLAVVHVGPPSMMTGAAGGWWMRYVPYNAGGALPGWVTRPRQRRRVAVTLGTVVPALTGVDSLRRLLDTAARTDAEFVLALGGAPEAGDGHRLGALPDNVRLVDWVPLAALLSSCDAVVHHGGAGTTMTAACAGRPQLILPHGADQFLNAGIVVRRGIGLSCEPDDVDEDILAALLGEERLVAEAASVVSEIAAQPSPVATVERLGGTVPK